MKTIHFGCSSYQNRAWQQLFYPVDLPVKQWFEYYCAHFNTFEINATFYTFPTLRVMQNWYDKAPAGFIYSVKAPKIITHINKFIDCTDELQQFYDVCRSGLGDKLGCVLFQLPPSFHYSDERLDLILQLLDTTFKNVVEFRNESWWRLDVMQSFQSRGISFCSVSYPGLPDDFIVTSRTAFVRFHGKQRLFYSGYKEDELRLFYQQLLDFDNADDAYIYFNNTAGREGILDALKMKKIAEECAHIKF